jgi:uncharacterized RDD family membrane protein YckC
MGKYDYVAIAILLLIPLVALLAIPTYNSINPNIGGVSFFYWYQILWMPLGAILYYIAAVIWNKREKDIPIKKVRVSKKMAGV